MNIHISDIEMTPLLAFFSLFGIFSTGYLISFITVGYLNYKPLMIIGQDLFILPNEKYDELKHIKKPLQKSLRNIPIFNWINRF